LVVDQVHRARQDFAMVDRRVTPGRVSRRQILRAGALLGLLGAVQSCSSPFAGRSLTLATGSMQGVYYNLGVALAAVWQDALGLSAPPEVRSTAGSLDNLRQLGAGSADVVFSQIDAAADLFEQTPQDSPRSLRALARIYDDVVHLVVPADSPITELGHLRGMRVSVGAPQSGVSLIASRLLAVAGLRAGDDLSAEQLGLTASATALVNRRLDAFFWSGGLPTQGVVDLAAEMQIRLVDLQSIIPDARKAYPEYAAGTVPAMSYGIPDAISTLLVRNVLLVTADMPDDLAGSLVESLFEAQQRLARATPIALTISPRAAIGTQPVPLHPGAEQFYRSEKDG
jgi:TRAP transporter TAXI family solute receptor